LKNKKVKIFFSTLVFIIFLSSFFVEAVSITQENKNKNINICNNDVVADLPQWSIGNRWIYDFNFNFDYSVLTINGAINNMELRVADINDQQDLYTVDITGELDASLKIAGIIPGGSFTGNVEGYAHFKKSTLSLKDFYFETDGSYTGIQTESIVEGSFSPDFDIFDFPIESSEDQSNPWEAETSASINGEITVLGIVSQSFDIEGDFEGEELYFEKEDEHNNFNCLLIRGNTGPEYGGYSKLWYSNEVGYLVDIQEKIQDWNGVTATLSMPLIYTNFNPDNSPPEIPDKPSGETDGELGESYSYSTQTIDNEGDLVYYKFDWGDGEETEWIGPYDSGTEVSQSHRWFKQGVYNVKVKARDESGIESFWSDPLAVTISSEDSFVTLLVHKLSNLDMDDIDFDIPMGEDETPPEWYYKVEAYSNDELVLSKTESNRKSNGDWRQTYTWTPDHEVGFAVDSYLVNIRIKLMDHDEGIEGLWDDLADISGCDHPDCDGRNDDTSYKRGAIYHGIYNLATDTLEPYSSDHNDYSDYFLTEDGYYKTRGDFPPDNTDDIEDFLSPENDACAWFDLWDNYDKPVVTAGVIDEGKLRKGVAVRFSGGVVDGASDYIWHWDFDDGTTSNDQNPVHTFEDTGTYTVELTLTDGLGYVTSDTVTVDIKENIRPEKPVRPSGKKQGAAGNSYTYLSSTTDSEGDVLYYLWDFGDGTDSGWLGPYNSGEEAIVTNSWSEKDSYQLKVKVVDDPNRDGDFSDGKESSWSDPLTVSMPQVKPKTNVMSKIEILYNFLQRLLIDLKIFQ